MRFSTIFTVIAAGAMAFASALPAKRSNADVQAALTALGNQCDTIVPKFGNCQDDDCNKNVILQMTAAIDDCKNTIGGLTGGNPDSDLANAVASVVNVGGGKLLGPHFIHTPFQKCTADLDDHKTTCGSGCPNLPTLYGQIDDSLSACLSTCFNLFSGLPALVTPL